MTDVGNHQDVVKKSCLHLLRNKPFKLGLEGSLYSPDDFFTDKWDQINYERGFHFRAILKREGLRPSLKLPMNTLKWHLSAAVRNKEII